MFLAAASVMETALMDADQHGDHSEVRKLAEAIAKINPMWLNGAWREKLGL